jgi:hypothetical protein
MALEWFLAGVVAILGMTGFSQFEEGSSKGRRLLRWGMFYGVTALLGRIAGRPWTFVWIGGLPLVGATFHLWWCRKHGIDPLTAEPRERYYQLRGWSR